MRHHGRMTAQSLNIFRAGTHTANNGQTLTFSESDMAAIATAYDPAKHEAPLVVGHPATDDPAYGWVAALANAVSGLEATPRNVDPDFAAMVNTERFNRISASFFMPESHSNPVPGVYYLRHVGFLGAAAPAVKGLRKPSFDLSDDSGTVTIEFSAHIEVPPVAEIQKDPPTNGGTVDYAAKSSALEVENATLKAELAQREAEIAATKAQQIRSEVANFAEMLIQQGRVLPRDKTGLVEFMAAIPADSVLEFSEEGQISKPKARAWLDEFLKRMPVQVDFSERTAGNGGDSISATDDPTVIARRAQSYLAEQTAAGVILNFAEAVHHVTRKPTQ